jgi:hypothetical protein
VWVRPREEDSMRIMRIIKRGPATSEKTISLRGGEHFSFDEVLGELEIQGGTYRHGNVHRFVLTSKDIDSLVRTLNLAKGELT